MTLGFFDYLLKKNKIFFLKHGKGCVSASKIVKRLQYYILERNTIGNDLFIHTDNGTKFIHKEYHDFITKHSLLIGSTSAVGHAEHNVVTKSTVKTLKMGMTKNIPANVNIDIPSVIKTTQ